LAQFKPCARLFDRGPDQHPLAGASLFPRGSAHFQGWLASPFDLRVASGERPRTPAHPSGVLSGARWGGESLESGLYLLNRSPTPVLQTELARTHNHADAVVTPSQARGSPRPLQQALFTEGAARFGPNDIEPNLHTNLVLDGRRMMHGPSQWAK
jgi:hypothetical protein